VVLARGDVFKQTYSLVAEERRWCWSGWESRLWKHFINHDSITVCEYFDNSGLKVVAWVLFSVYKNEVKKESGG
jgi:hypothetical protein